MYNKLMKNKTTCTNNNISKKISSNFRQANEYEKIVFGLKCLELLENPDIEAIYHEYNEALPFDDVVIKYNDRIDFYQIKHSTDTNALIKYNDIATPTELNIDISRYKEIYEKYKNYKYISYHIYTNRSADEELCKIISDNTFSIKFIRNEIQKKKWQELKNNSKIQTNDEFINLLNALHFDFKQDSLENLKVKLRSCIIGLGFSENIYLNFLNSLNTWWLESYSRAITKQDIEQALQIQNALIHQNFDINYNLFIDNLEFKRNLKNLINNNYKYISIIGPPGSGKSTFINNFVEKESCQIIKYLCYSNLENSILDVENRANINTFTKYFIKQFQLRYSDILNELDNHTKYDYSEENYINTVNKVASFFEQQNSQLVIVIDGIDHVIRTEIENNFLKLLQHSPNGILFILTAQNEIHLPKTIKNYCTTHSTLLNNPLFTKNNCLSYLNKYFKHDKQKLSILIKNINNIYSKTEGLPLYLRYLAETLKDIDLENFNQELLNLPNIQKQNITDYYETIWTQFDNDSVILKFCAFIANIDFNITKTNLFKLLGKSSFEAEQELSKIKHLLNIQENSIKTFHNSFKEFINKKLTSEQKQEIYDQILLHLKSLDIFDETAFNYIFEYAFLSNDYRFLYNTITSNFIEESFLKGKNEYQLKEIIQFGLQASKKEKNIIEFSRLALVYAELDKKYSDYHINKVDLYNVYLAQKDFKNLFNLFSKNSIIFDVNEEVAQILINLSYENLSTSDKDICGQLVKNFIDKYVMMKDETTHFSGWVFEQKILELMAIYSNKYSYLYSVINNLNKVIVTGDIASLNPSIILFNSVLEHLYRLKKYSHIRCIKHIIKKFFYNLPVYEYWVLRNLKLKLKYNIHHNKSLYFKSLNKIHNNDLLIQALKIGIEIGIDKTCLKNCSKNIKYYLELNPDNIRYDDRDRQLTPFRDYITICLYLSDGEKFNAISNNIIKENHWLAFYYELNLDLIKGIYEKQDVNYFLELFGRLNNKKRLENERIFEAFDIIKQDLPKFLYLLLSQMNINCSNTLLINQKILEFFNSEIANTHYGISIINVNFTSSFKIIEFLIKHCVNFVHVEPIIKQLEEKIHEEAVETNERTSHYLRLSALAYKAKLDILGKEYFTKGIKSSNGYNNRKDVTLFNLIEALDLIKNKFDQKDFLNYFYEIAQCSNWLFTITDHSETRHIRKDVFKLALNYNYDFGLFLLKKYQNKISDWETSDCIKYLVEKYNGNNYMLIYVFTQCIQNDNYGENNYANRFDARMSIFEKVIKSSTQEIKLWFYNQIYKYLKCDIPECHERYNLIKRFNSMLKETTLLPISNKYIANNKMDNTYNDNTIEKYEYKGNDYSIEELVSIALKSIDNFIEVYSYTERKRGYFSIHNALEKELNSFIDKINLEDDLDKIFEFVSNSNRGISCIDKTYELIANKYKLINKNAKYITALQKCFASSIEYGFKYYTKVRMDVLKILLENSYDNTIKYLLKEAFDTIISYPFQGKIFQQFIIKILLDFGTESNQQEAINLYKNYHKEIMKEFENLPNNEFSINYDWIKDYISNNETDNLMLDIIFKEWCDYPYYKRLEMTHLISDLAIYQPDFVIPKLFSSINYSNCTLAQLASLVLNYLSKTHVNLLITYQENLVKLIKNISHFEISYLLIDTLHAINPACVNELIASLYYSDLYILNIEDYKPLQIFQDKFIKYVPNAFLDYVKDVSKEIGIPEDNIFFEIEQILTKNNVNYELEKENHQNLYQHYCHNGTNNFVPFENNFGNLTYHALNEVIEQKLRDYKLGIDNHQRLHKILKIYDSNFYYKNVKENTNFVSKLPNKNDIQKWINFEDITKVKNIKLKDIETEEITIVDDYTISDKEFYEQVYSYVAYGQKKKFFFNLFSNIFNLTTSNIYLLNPELQEKYNLAKIENIPSYKNNNGIQINQKIWQNGLEDNDMSFRILAHGTKITIKKELLEQILKQETCELIIVNFMKRYYHPETYKKEESKCNKIIATTTIKI